MGTSTKIVVTNYSALKNKGYQDPDVDAVKAALAKLVQADQDRGITTTVVDLSDKNDMARYQAPVVTSATDEKQNKDAIDAVFHHAAPDYLMLLGSLDVIPHQTLKDTTGDDPSVPSDLPYACETTYDQGQQDPVNFTSPSRVVGRLPDVTGKHEPDYLVSLVRYSAAATPAPRDTYQAYFALSAAVWEKSTQENLTTIFNDASALHLVPPDGSPWSASALASKSHFANCHGGPGIPTGTGRADSPIRWPSRPTTSTAPSPPERW